MRCTSGVLAAIIATVMHPLSVSAGMYSAQPTSTASNTFRKSAYATWTGSAEEPRLTDMGLIKMDLYSASNVCRDLFSGSGIWRYGAPAEAARKCFLMFIFLVLLFSRLDARWNTGTKCGSHFPLSDLEPARWTSLVSHPQIELH